MYAHEYIKKTYNSKAKYLGQGCFSKVYQHPTNPDRVLKFVKGDMAYINYARFAMKNPQNPYLPKVFSIEKSTYLGFDYIVELEKLKPCTAVKDKQIVRKFQRFGDLELQRGPYKSISWITTSSWKKLAKLSPCPDFKQTMNYIMNKASGVDGIGDDIHRGNIMFRQNQLVFTDPLVD